MSEPPPDQPLVWIVDDSPTERAITVHALGAGYTFEEFGDGADAVERLNTRTARPDVILLDWVMPGMTGDEVCRYVRAHEEFSDLAIIMFTASRVETDDVVRGLAVGANDYVAKPFVPEELRARVHAVLRSKELRDAANRERTRLAALNRLGRALFAAGADVPRILHELVSSLQGLVADGCAIIVLPGDLEPIAVAVHRADPSAAMLSSIATLADPMIHAFTGSDDALAKLPPLYHPYIQQYGLRGLAILPFPVRNPVQGVVTLTRDGASEPFEVDDVAAIETCIEYASLAVQYALRFEAERTARARLTAVLEHAPVGIIVAGANGAIDLANPVAVQLVTGIETAGTLDRAFGLGTWSTPDGAPIARELWPFGRGADGKAHREQLVFTPPGGESRVLSLTTVTRREVDELAGTVTAIEDVTVQHAFAVEREQVAAFQEQMLGIVGHDLRNPLNAIVTGTELIGEHARELPRIQAVVTRIQSSSRRMTSIVDQLLDVTRARLGDGIPLSIASVTLGPLVQSLVDELAPTYHDAKFVVLADQVRGVWDPERLEQVISNLISNAAQYGDRTKPIQIRVTAEAGTAVVEVSNSIKDAPIPAERLATLFEPYRRGATSMSAHRKGLGLGLYIAHEIVRAHQGKLTATSTAEGTVFRVELPIRGSHY
ncbi:MAG: response regulator [Deltaproteobacteria bacterium]|nr:response regulator [Deltaproteobacteria bacterium]